MAESRVNSPFSWNESENQWTYDIWMIYRNYPDSTKEFTALYAGFNEYVPFSEYDTLEFAKQAVEDFVKCGSNIESWKKYYQKSCDWPEDFHLENGNYQNTCCICKKKFVGYKRRIVCKICATKE